nr:hypothetical protein [Tanacetum cinerariifolium]
MQMFELFFFLRMRIRKVRKTFWELVLGGNYSSTKQVNFIQRFLAYSLITGTEIDIGKIIYSDLVTKLLNKSRLKYVSYPRFISCTLQVLLDPDYNQDKKFWVLPYDCCEQSKGLSVSTSFGCKTKQKEFSDWGNKQPLDKYITSTTPDEGMDKTTLHLEGSLRHKDLGGTTHPLIWNHKTSPTLFSQGLDEDQESKEDILGAGKEMDDNPQSAKTQHQSSPPQEDKPTSSTAPHTEASDTDSSSDKILNKYDDTLPLTEKSWSSISEKSSIDDYYNENIAHRDQTGKLVKASMSSLKKSSTTINDLYKGLEVITQLLKNITKYVKDDPATNKKIEEASKTLAKISTQTSEILSLVRSFNFSTLQSTVKNIQDHAFNQEEVSAAWMKSSTNMAWNLEKPEEPKQLIDANIEFIGSSTHPPLITQAQPITIIHPEPSDKKEEIKKAEEEARLNVVSKTKVIKVVREEAKKLGIHPKEAITTKSGELFKKAQDSKHEVYKRQHTEKVKNLLNSESTIYRGTHGRNFDVHKPFLFRAFGISEFDELRKIIPKKKNAVVKDLMNSLSRRYKRLRQIRRELGIHSALPALEKTSSQTSGRKRKHMKLEPETRLPGLECNQALPENVSSSIPNSDVDKVEMEAFVSYLVAAFMVKSPENARFSMKLRKLIAEHLDQEKLKSKKVKLKGLGYKMD